MLAVSFDNLMSHRADDPVSQLQTILTIGVGADKIGEWLLAMARPTFF